VEVGQWSSGEKTRTEVFSGGCDKVMRYTKAVNGGWGYRRINPGWIYDT